MMKRFTPTQSILLTGVLFAMFAPLSHALTTKKVIDGVEYDATAQFDRALKVDESVRRVFLEDVGPVNVTEVMKDRFTPGVDYHVQGGVSRNGDITYTMEEILPEILDQPIDSQAHYVLAKSDKTGEPELLVPTPAPSFVFLPETSYRSDRVTTRKLVPNSETTFTDPSGTTVNLVKAASQTTKTRSMVGAGLNNATRIDINGVHFRDINYITQTGLNAGSQKVVNVEDGLIAHGSKDAINGGQLYDELQKIKAGDVDWKRIHRMGAMAAALAGLHPMEYDERHRFSAAAAYGNYRSGHGLAAGLFYRPDHRMMVSAGLAVSPGGDKMLNLGASYRLGAQKNEYASTFKDFASSEVAHQLTVNLRHVKEDLDDHKVDTKAKLTSQQALIEKQRQRLQAQAREIARLKAKLTAQEATNKAFEARFAELEARLKP